MTTAKKIFHIAGTGFDRNSDYAAQRNLKQSKWPWMPAGEKGLRFVKKNETTYLYDHNGNRIVMECGNIGSDDQNNQSGYGMDEWNPGNRSSVASHSVNKNKPYFHWSVYGWNPTYKGSQGIADLHAARCSPISDFIGVTFKWDGYGSYWNDRAIKIEPDYNGAVRSPTNTAPGGVSLNVYNAKTDQVNTMFTFREDYNGWDVFRDRHPGTGESNTKDDNWTYWKMASSDCDYVLNNPVFLIGLNIQFYSDNKGSASRVRRLNFWDLNPVFNPSIGGTYEQKGAKLVLPAAYAGALGDMYQRFNRNQTKPIVVNHD